MTSPRVIGHCRGRPVSVLRLPSSVEFQTNASLASATVLLIDAQRDRSQCRRTLRALLRANPLSVTVSNTMMFDVLLDELQHQPTVGHTMTDLGGPLPEMVEDFLNSTWPDEDRFEAWREHVVIVIGDEHLSDEVVEAGRNHCRA